MSFVIKWDPKDFPDTDVLLSSKVEGEPWPVFVLMGFLHHKAMLNQIFRFHWELLKFTFSQDSVPNSSMKGIQCNTFHRTSKSPAVNL